MAVFDLGTAITHGKRRKMIPNNIKLAYIRSITPKDKKKPRALRHCPNRKNVKQLLYLQYVRERGAQIVYKEFDPDFTRKPNYLPERYDFGWLRLKGGEE